MAGSKARFRTREDLTRAVRAVARHFKTDTVYLIGSQAILASWPDAPLEARMSVEFDAYPGNAAAWEISNAGLEASEEINALFGFGSGFTSRSGSISTASTRARRRCRRTGWRVPSGCGSRTASARSWRSRPLSTT